ncbi:hypothetical protein AB6A40_006094 [Gnathostoma spinigerum]|uniref:Nbr1 FW domain-containing protein n=1 Tax=Gnathostoma spinigerum TaxID=75299 RepID=A0ABD6EHC1_9BILA
MDLDGDVEGSLAQALSCMATNDREVLIRQFQLILGENHQLAPEACAFFLDMNNWNLHAALGAYYDYGSSNNLGVHPPEYATHLPSMQFIQDITIGEGESVPPSTRFLKTWRVRNNGTEWWPTGCYIGFMEGAKLSEVTRSCVQPLAPGEEVNVSVEMISPAEKGIYQSRWQLNTSSGIPFGESIWCIITVDEMGILDITQQLASAPLGCSYQDHSANPFSSSCLSQRSVDMNIDNDTNRCESQASTQNGNSLFSAVVARLPPKWTVSDQSGASASQPINIIQKEESPDVPPCTPCTPPP